MSQILPNYFVKNAQKRWKIKVFWMYLSSVIWREKRESSLSRLLPLIANAVHINMDSWIKKCTITHSFGVGGLCPISIEDNNSSFGDGIFIVVFSIKKIIRKKWTTIIKISKDEVEYLLSKGLKFGTNGNGEIHRTFSNVKTYYLTTTSRAMKLLSEYRKLNVRNT